MLQINVTDIMDLLHEGKNDLVAEILKLMEGTVKSGVTVTLIQKILEPWPSQKETVTTVRKITKVADVKEYKKELNKIQRKLQRELIK
jgi:hypothetical protein